MDMLVLVSLVTLVLAAMAFESIAFVINRQFAALVPFIKWGRQRSLLTENTCCFYTKDEKAPSGISREMFGDIVET